MTERPTRLCYVLPEFSHDICSHLYHTWELLEDLTHRVKIYLFVERAAETPNLKFAEHVYVQRFTRFPFRLLERFLIFSLIRLRGYRNFYVHISHFSSLLAAVVARLSGGRAYYWNCGLRSVSANERRSFRSRMRQKFLNDCAFRLNLKMINYLVTGTPLMAEHYSQNYGISVNKIKVIPNSINLARFQPGNYDCVKIREELGVPEGNKVVLFVHWLSERKGAHYLTEIISKVSDKNPHTTLIIIGDGPYHARLAQEINNTGLAKYARITGGVPNTEVSRYYAIADLFIMPSTDEGFPRVLLEAMAMGVPFVANDIGGVRDIVTARQLAFISPVGDIALFSDNIIRLLNDDKMRDELKAEGFAKVKEFEKQAVADLFAKMIAAK